MKKTIIVVLALVMALGMLSACGTPSASPSTSATPPTSTATIEVQKITFLTPQFHSILTSLDMLTMQKIQENTGVQLEIQCVPSGDDLQARLLLAFSSNVQPEIIWTNNTDTIRPHIEGGSVLELSQYFGTKLANLKKCLEAYPDLYRDMFAGDGKIYYIPRGTPLRYGTMIECLNYDWLQAVNKEIPTNYDELYEVMKAFKTDKPDSTPYKRYCFSNLWDGAAEAYEAWMNGWDQSWFYNGEKIIYGPYNQEAQFRELFAFTSKMWKEGLVDPDNDATNGYYGDVQKEAMKKGDTGFFHFWFDGGFLIVKDGEWDLDFILLKPLAKDANSTRKTMMGPRIEGAGCVGGRSLNIDAALKVLDYVYSDEGIELMNWGVKDDTFTVDSNGVHSFTDKVTKDPDKNTADMMITLGIGVMCVPGFYPAEDTIQKRAAQFADEETLVWYSQLDDLAEANSVLPYMPKLQGPKADEDNFSQIRGAVAGVFNANFPIYSKGEKTADAWSEIVQQFKDKGIDDALAIKNAQLQIWKSRP